MKENMFQNHINFVIVSDSEKSAGKRQCSVLSKGLRPEQRTKDEAGLKNKNKLSLCKRLAPLLDLDQDQALYLIDRVLHVLRSGLSCRRRCEHVSACKLVGPTLV